MAHESQKWSRRCVLLIAGLFAFRLTYAATVPLDLCPDEAYYWDWSRDLDWGYYSKPPMIAWLIRLASSLGGSTCLVVRLPAVLLGTLGLVFVYQLGKRLYGARAGFWSVVLMAAMPGSGASSLLMTIDAPLLFCWAAALYTCWRMLERGPRASRWLALSVLCVGAGLLSKQTMMAFPVLTGLFLAVSPEGRLHLRRPWFWVWVGGAFLFLTPVIYWNSQHDWIAFQHTGQHFDGGPVDLSQRLWVFGEYLVSQGGVASPVTSLLVAVVGAIALCFFQDLGRKERFLVCLSAVPLYAVLILSLRQHVQPNWPAPFYIAGVILTASWLTGCAKIGRGQREHPRLLKWTVSVAVAWTGIALFLPYGLKLANLHGSRVDVAVRLRGWQRLGNEIGQVRDGLQHWPGAFVLAATRRDVASELAFYLPGQPLVFVWNDSQRIKSQYDIWGGPSDSTGKDALIVSHGRRLPSGLKDLFEQIHPLRRVDVSVGNSRRHSLQLWRGHRFRGDWHQDDQPGEQVANSAGPGRRHIRQ